MQRLAAIPYRYWLLAIFLMSLAASLIDPREPMDAVMEHTPTVAALGFLAWIDRRPLSNLAYTLIFAYLMLHVIGAHYLYSHVPYDAWSMKLVGINITKAFGFERNHYDRLVHFMHGLLLFAPLRECIARWMRIGGLSSALTAIAFLAVMSTIYELIEWLIAISLSPEAAENYNGQQGDVFDPQKDMALALAGALIAGCLYMVSGPRRVASNAASQLRPE